MSCYLLPHPDPLCRSWLLDELPGDFPARLRSLLQRGDGSGVLGLPPGAGLVRADIRRQVGGAWLVVLRFAGHDCPPAADLAELLGPLMGLPLHPLPPAHLKEPPASATGTVIA